VVSFLFGLFGLIPAVRHSRMARERGYPTGGYWWSFWLAWLVPYALVALLLGLLLVDQQGSGPGGSQAPSNVPLPMAVANTLAARNYSQVLTESTPQGKQTDYVVYQAPDRLGGYVQSGTKRTYVYVIGTNEYQSQTVSPNTPTNSLVFYRQANQGAKALDPVRNYVHYATQAKHVTQSGRSYSFSLTQQGQVGKFVMTVSGKFVSRVLLTVRGASIQLVVSQVGTSPPVALPAGAKVVAAPSGAGSSALAG
jgi:hypothetical protein